MVIFKFPQPVNLEPPVTTGGFIIIKSEGGRT